MSSATPVCLVLLTLPHSDALNIAVDTTFGVLILYAFLKLFTSLLFHYQPSQFRTGDYGSPPSFRIWSKQAAVYVTCLGLMKIVVLGMFWAIPGLFVFANWCLSWLDSDEAQVVAVMLVFPCAWFALLPRVRSLTFAAVVMNVLQFLISQTSLPPLSQLQLTLRSQIGRAHV